MAKIIVNDSLMVEGSFTITCRKQIETKNGIAYEFAGELITPYYIEELESVESPRYKAMGIDVYEEQFGSDDENILYMFTFTEMEVLYNEPKPTKGVEKND